MSRNHTYSGFWCLQVDQVRGEGGERWWALEQAPRGHAVLTQPVWTEEMHRERHHHAGHGGLLSASGCRWVTCGYYIYAKYYSGLFLNSWRKGNGFSFIAYFPVGRSPHGRKRVLSQLFVSDFSESSNLVMTVRLCDRVSLGLQAYIVACGFTD